MKDNFLGTEKMWKLVLRIAIPSMLAQFVSVLYSIVDRIYIGNMPEVGLDALASVGICGPIVTLICSFASLVGLGGAPIFSIRLGEKNNKGAEQVLANSFLMLAVLSVVLTIVVFVAKTPMLYAFGASDKLFPMADEYLTYYTIGTVFAIMGAGLNSFIVAQGFAKTAMATVLVGAVANICLDPLFIFTFNMGVKGAAIATVISQAISAIFAFAFLSSKHSFIKITYRGYNRKTIGKIILLGLSPFLIIATDSVMLIALNSALQQYGGASGDTLIASATIVLSFMQVITMPLGGITGGTQPILSYNYGARNTARVKLGQKLILLMCIIFTTMMTFFAQFGSQLFVKIFTKDPELIAMSIKYIKIYTMMIIPLSFQYSLVDGLTALGIAPVAISLSLFRKVVVMLTLILVLPQFFGVESIFFSEPIADAVSCLSSTIVYSCIINRILNKRAKALLPASTMPAQQ
ncbi:MAG: MATE family efflux transporter [Clostridia bacterium]